MSKIKSEPRAIFGYGLIVFGVILLIYTFIQAGITFSNLMEFIGRARYYMGASALLPGFAPALSWFFMLLIQTLIGFFIASIGVRIAKK